jgi:hypothetical protein
MINNHFLKAGNPTPAPSLSSISAGSAHPHLFQHNESRPEVIARLEWLDDLMFAAIYGDANALQSAAEAWQKTKKELGSETVEESRLQYLRCAQGIWHSLRRQPNHPPHRVFAAIEVISLLAGRVQ